MNTIKFNDLHGDEHIVNPAHITELHTGYKGDNFGNRIGYRYYVDIVGRTNIEVDQLVYKDIVAQL